MYSFLTIIALRKNSVGRNCGIVTANFVICRREDGNARTVYRDKGASQLS
ncbi:MAG: hypothetical protein ACI87W_003152 [Halieaceae bacterium]